MFQERAGRVAMRSHREPSRVVLAHPTGEFTIPRTVIEREIPEFGAFEREALREAAHESNGLLAQ